MLIWSLMMFVGLFAASEPRLQEAKKEKPRTATELTMEVAALQLFYDLQLTNEQLEKLQKWTKETAQKPRVRKEADISKGFQAKLTELHRALAASVDGEVIESLIGELDEIRDEEIPLLDDKVEITPAARKRTPEAVRLLAPKQVAALLALDGPSIADPRERLIEALEDVRGLEGDEWKVRRDGIAAEIARLVAGTNAKKHEQVSDDVVVLLVKCRKLDGDEFQSQRNELEKEAATMFGDLGPLDFLRNYLEYNLAEMLSNPRLAHAIKERLASPAAKKEKEL